MASRPGNPPVFGIPQLDSLRRLDGMSSHSSDASDIPADWHEALARLWRIWVPTEVQSGSVFRHTDDRADQVASISDPRLCYVGLGPVKSYRAGSRLATRRGDREQTWRC